MKQKTNITQLPKKDLPKDTDDRSVVSSLSFEDSFLCNDVIFDFCFMKLNFF